ncbi:hypothetical protein [Dyadobacter sp. CY347]|uniref:hypothetical protein n=1 Tax=Dyadobacter sp. CY347 TaxID=2909336 RepID=UPI001F46FEB3|nr:hypothetical protein [Dyadobacter sp. CY347]MCF2491040.1 hypothetical protein [Dyadobacter sp. CY347]
MYLAVQSALAEPGFSFFFLIPRVETRGHFIVQPNGLFSLELAIKAVGLFHFVASGFNLGIIRARIFFAPDGAFLFSFFF